MFTLFLLLLIMASNAETIPKAEDGDTPITLQGIPTDTSSAYGSFCNDNTGRIQPKEFFKTQLDEVEGVELNVVEGSVPEWLSGNLYRVGGGLFKLGNREVHNMVDGLSKVHSWNFTPGKATTFTAKFLKSRIYNASIAKGEIAAMQHMGDMEPPLTFLEKVKVVADIIYNGNPDNNNIAVWELSKKGITVTNESPLYIEVDYDTLDYQQHFRVVPDELGMFDKEIISASHFSRHPTTGDSINYKFVVPLIPTHKPAYHMIRYSTNEEGKLIATTIGKVDIEGDDMRLIHSLGATENFAILPRFSLVVSRVPNMFKICDAIKFNREKPTVMEVFSLKDGKHTSFKFPAGESQHIINSFERYNKNNELEVVIDYPTKGDVSTYPEDKCIFELLDIRNLMSEDYIYQKEWQAISDMVIRRYIMNMDTGVGRVYEFPQMWKPKILQVEFPYINDNFRGLPYCYAYFHAWQYDVKNHMGLLKVDMCNEVSISWEEKNKFPVEPIYAARPGSTEEDDGVIMSPVFDSTTSTTELYIWNAKDLKVLARLDSPIRVPFTLHGLWKDK